MNIAISILTWNNVENTKYLLNSLVSEFHELLFENSVFINICDNGSIDGTIEYFENDCRLPINVIRLDENKGISIAKNLLIEKAIKDKIDYMFMFDNDIAVITGSLKKMLKHISENKNVACLGHNIDYYTKDKKSDLIPNIFPPLENLNFISNKKSGCGAVRSWTHYSVYNMEVFRNGIRFETDGPFSGPGYGFDDDDLGMQIHTAGYDIICFTDVHCYHNISSSVSVLEESDQLNYHTREEFFKNKWREK